MLYFQILCKELKTQTFHSQTKIVCMSLDAYMEVEKDKWIEDKKK